MVTKDRPRKNYPSDLTDEQWAIVEPMIAPAKQNPQGGRTRRVDRREVPNTIAQRRNNRAAAEVVTTVGGRTRVAAGREPTPSVAGIDS